MDRVKLHLLERAELEDISALQDLTYEHLKRCLGQFLGAGDVENKAAGGLLSHALPSVDASNMLSFSDFAFCSLWEGETGLVNGNVATPEAAIVRFLTSSPQVNEHVNYPLDLGGYRVPATNYEIYARPVEVDTDQTTRRQWNTATGAEVSVQLQTRTRERVQFEAFKAQPSGAGPVRGNGNPWVKLFNYTVDSSNNFTFEPVSLFDALDAKALSRLTPAPTAQMINTYELLETTARDSSYSVGVLEQLALMRAQLARILHTSPYTATDSRRWTDPPASSISELNATLSALNTQQTALNTTLDGVSTVQYLYFRYMMTWTSTTVTFVVNSTDAVGCTPTLDAVDQISGLFAGGMASQDFLRIIKRPVIVFPDATYECLSHNIVPVTLRNDPTQDSLIQGAGIPNPFPFTYSVTGGTITGSPTHALISSGPYNHHLSGTLLSNIIIGFNIQVDPIPINASTYEIVYDIMLTVRKKVI